MTDIKTLINKLDSQNIDDIKESLEEIGDKDIKESIPNILKLIDWGLMS